MEKGRESIMGGEVKKKVKKKKNGKRNDGDGGLLGWIRPILEVGRKGVVC